jgi:hypothetical protein
LFHCNLEKQVSYRRAADQRNDEIATAPSDYSPSAIRYPLLPEGTAYDMIFASYMQGMNRTVKNFSASSASREASLLRAAPDGPILHQDLRRSTLRRTMMNPRPSSR